MPVRQHNVLSKRKKVRHAANQQGSGDNNNEGEMAGVELVMRGHLLCGCVRRHARKRLCFLLCET